jgi:DnaJ-class molecular chaperone
VDHLDGRKLVITTRQNEVISPGKVEVIAGEGMPSRGDLSAKGNLYVQYSVVFPDFETLTSELQQALCKVVPNSEIPRDLDLNAEDVVTVTPDEGDIEDFNNAQRERREKRNEAYSEGQPVEDDDEHEEGEGEEGEQVGCQPM